MTVATTGRSASSGTTGSFPYREGFLTGVTVFARGEVRPDVGALPGVTNRVPLLIGVEYTVTSCRSPSRRPSSRTPSSPRTTRAALSSDGRSDSGSRSTSGIPGGSYGFEEASFSVTGGACRCGFEDPPDPPTPPFGGPLFLLSFSNDAVIFEDEYEDAPGVKVERRSTTTTAYVDVYGGEDGCFAFISMKNQDWLERTRGPSLPTRCKVPRLETKRVRFDFRGQSPSDSEGDIELRVQIGAATVSDKATSVQVEIAPEDKPPLNPVPNRHVFGIKEKFFHA